MESRKSDVLQFAVEFVTIMGVMLGLLMLLLYWLDPPRPRPPAGQVIPKTHYTQAGDLAARVAALESQVAKLRTRSSEGGE